MTMMIINMAKVLKEYRIRFYRKSTDSIIEIRQRFASDDINDVINWAVAYVNKILPGWDVFHVARAGEYLDKQETENDR